MYLIGLTGNIATGKSTVCDILTQLGARVIDADLVAHTALRRGTAAWRALIEAFGYDILTYDGTVDRRKLGAIVFNDATKLRILEQITHPAVGAELALLIRDALHAPAAGAILVVEAVKLYESGIYEYMDALWVVTAPRAEQKRRLMQERGMNEADANARLDSQPPVDEKLNRAQVVIDNGGSIEDLRVQVMRAFVQINPETARDKTALLQKWLRLETAPTATANAASAPIENAMPASTENAMPASTENAMPASTENATLAPTETENASAPTETENASAPTETENASAPTETENAPATASAEWTVRRARPADARMLAELLARIEGRNEAIGRAEMLERLGKFGYWFVRAGDQTVALAAWQAENLAAIVRELWAANDADATRAFPLLLEAIQTEANALTCEVVAIVVPERAAQLAAIAAQTSGYESNTVEQLHKLWRSVIEPLLSAKTTLYTKQLREIVIKPI